MTAPVTKSQAYALAPDSLTRQIAEWTTARDTTQLHLDLSARDYTASTTFWEGAAADRARAAVTETATAATTLTTALTAAITTATTARTKIAMAQQVTIAAIDLAEKNNFQVAEDGTVTPPDAALSLPADATPADLAMAQGALNHTAKTFYEPPIKLALAGLGQIVENATAAIDSAFEPLTAVKALPSRVPVSLGERGQRVQDVVDGKAALHADQQGFGDFWQTLGQEEKDALWLHDQYLGNRDGMPVAERDHYNRIKLADELARARAGDPAVSGKFADLEAVDKAVNTGPLKNERMLLLLDTQSGAQAHAAVSVGNPDTADHVSVTTPGLNTTVHSSIGSMVAEATTLRNTAVSDLLTANRPDSTVATIAWIGYDAPQLANTDEWWDTDNAQGGWDVAHDDLAANAAPRLASFYQGLQVSHGGDPHLTAVGHSYGSLVTGMALQQPGPHPVDDLVVYGSPGLDTGYNPWENALDKLNLDPGHAYEMTAHDDAVASLNGFGLSPGYIPGFTHLETDAEVTPDGVRRDGAVGHSEYPRSGDDGEQLRTTGYNVAAVVAGLPVVEGDPGYKTGPTDLGRAILDWVR
ncbi:alpha/beta hydrolase [Nocardia sp. NPDC057668]|uniref:alpha/beta hydrolase n=1 Tax=Nocardia sp. NPDC057668 TaxID=3346202 RepID=UPI003672BBBE